jgi:hypothetical protein
MLVLAGGVLYPKVSHRQWPAHVARVGLTQARYEIFASGFQCSSPNSSVSAMLSTSGPR